jgi:hypothetical protein
MTTNSEIDRRKFIKVTATGAAGVSLAVLGINSGTLFAETSILQNNLKPVPDAIEIFKKCGACSHTYFYILSREFGHLRNAEERLASNPLAGGLMMTGHQCGMLWGSSLAVGAESFRRYNDHDQATAIAITTTQDVMESFSKRAKTVDCHQILGCHSLNPFCFMKLMAKALFHGGFKNFPCYKIAENWAPEAIQVANEGLSKKPIDLPQLPLSCASEVAKR